MYPLLLQELVDLIHLVFGRLHLVGSAGQENTEIEVSLAPMFVRYSRNAQQPQHTPPPARRVSIAHLTSHGNCLSQEPNPAQPDGATDTCCRPVERGQCNAGRQAGWQE